MSTQEVTAGLRCSSCGARCRVRVFSSRLRACQCRSCGHAVADHAPSAAAAGSDYHAAYDQGGFLDALALTRRRQALRITALIREVLPDARAVVDFGAGRAFFLEAARTAGFERLVGVDSSALAVDLIRASGFEGYLADFWSADVAPRPRLGLRADVLTLLDIIEHFPADEAGVRLRDLIRQFSPRLLVVKVPVTDGLLYRSASALAALRMPALIEQLFQCGTQPPHRSYFSRRSVERLLVESGLEIVRREPDRDFDARALARRVQWFARRGERGARVATLLGGLLERAVELSSGEDSLTLLARPVRASG